MTADPDEHDSTSLETLTPEGPHVSHDTVAPEAAMIRAAARFGAVAVLPATVLALWLRGPAGAVTALGGLVLIIAWFGLSGLSLAWGARRGPFVLQAVALGGFVVRFAILGLIMLALAPVETLDAPVLAVTVSVGMVALLLHEVRFVLGRADLWWLRLTQGKERA